MDQAIVSMPEFSLPQSAREARDVQENLRAKIRLEDDASIIRVIAGIDVGYDNARGLAHASIVVMSLEDLQPIEQVQKFTPVNFPYVPGLLSFREIPAILSALMELEAEPDLLMIDGHGVAHPRRMGIASHLGVLLDMPTIGVAKKRLTGEFEEPGELKGDRAMLMDGNERIGTVLRSRNCTKPLFISPGHRISFETAEMIVSKCITKYRLPEPTRLADKHSKCKSCNEYNL